MDPITLSVEAELTTNREARTITGRIVKFGEVLASHGLVLSPTALRPRMPLRRVKLLRDHDHGQPVGFMTDYTPVSGHADATFHVPEGADGDRALSEAESGLRDGMSVGFRPIDYALDVDGNIRVDSADFYEVSLCAVPAFADTGVASVAASVATAKDEMRKTMDHEQQQGQGQQGQGQQGQGQQGQGQQGQGQQGQPATLSATGQQQQRPATGGIAAGFNAAPAATLSARDQFRLDVREKGIELALTDIVAADVFDDTAQPGWLGEVWSAANRRQHYAPLVSHDTLTSQKSTGWAWVNRPDVYDYDGNLAEVTSGNVDTKPVNVTAARTASAHRVDRIHTDLPNEGFWDGFYRERATNYSKKIDRAVLAHLALASNHTARTVPSTTTLAQWYDYLYDGAEYIWDETGLAPSYFIVSRDLFKEAATSAEDEKLAYLSGSFTINSGNLEGVTIVKAPGGAGAWTERVIAGTRDATTLKELPGAPIRVEELDVSHGGVVTGLFGYHSLFTSDVRGVVSITKAAV